VNYYSKKLCSTGADLIELFGVNVLTLFRKVDQFTIVKLISASQKRFSFLNLHQKSFYEIDHWGLYHKTNYDREKFYDTSSWCYKVITTVNN
jgi:hypothetical protein